MECSPVGPTRGAGLGSRIFENTSAQRCRASALPQPPPPLRSPRSALGGDDDGAYETDAGNLSDFMSCDEGGDEGDDDSDRGFTDDDDASDDGEDIV